MSKKLIILDLLAADFVVSVSFWVRLGAMVLRASLYRMLSHPATALKKLLGENFK